ncbi:substrate-binding domain-containing protein [Tenacibaculum sp. SG-28]|uniref:substrate-binding domain-containing protein n=1 Tax=Tenacibaculum sp. SG-28 TaxID=754426 RepID=UPI000CF4723D|nr:substrate-binding domain-containing protein [Tenacibaculum sp. SG-28]PQJ23125.1 ABC transporter substrate-binding protein [Tenacibaculum sp. SG-28]
MLDIKIGGVPEHFNYPWYITLKDKQYAAQDINLRWKDFPGGTGAMCKALRNGEIDIAIVLTEGIIKDIIDGNPSKITQTFVDSPLIWGIHVAANSTFDSIDSLEGATVAISRYGSGSHLMAIVNAQNRGWDIHAMKFKVVGDLQGGISALENGTADYFMWEHFTTKPLVDNGTFRRVGDCLTPWPCFVIAIRDEVLENYPEAIVGILDTINNCTKNFKTISGIDVTLAERYEQKIEDIQRWLSLTEWNKGEPITEEEILSFQNKLIALNVISERVAPEKLIRNMYIC